MPADLSDCCKRLLLVVASEFDYSGEREYYARPVTGVRDWRWMAKDMAHWIPGFPAVFKDKSVLDIGAGECFLTFVIAESGQARNSVALELIPHRMQAARQVALPGLGLVCGDCFKLPFEDDSFDIVVGNGVLHHLPDKDPAIGEIARVLRPSGTYFGREPNFRNPLVKRKVLGGHHSPNEHAVSPAEIKASFARSGFNAQVSYFWRRLPWLHHPWLSVSIAIVATKLKEAWSL